MPVRQTINEGLVPVEVYTGEIEPGARQQLVNISRLPIVHHHLAAMPDVHLGIGATVGSVIPTRKAIIPAAVGVDIGCGMMAAQLSLTGSELHEAALKKVFGQISRDVPVGTTRVIEFVPTEPGDWAMHCHMTHHVMMQMGHGLPNMVGARTDALDHRMSRVFPEYMTMGTNGMGGMGEMTMPMPPNSLPMRGGPGPFGYVDMGGMFTVLKVRERPSTADAAGWYRHPTGTVADIAELAGNVWISMVVRDGALLPVRADTRVRAGDLVTLLIDEDSSHEVAMFNKPGEAER